MEKRKAERDTTDLAVYARAAHTKNDKGTGIQKLTDLAVYTGDYHKEDKEDRAT